MPWMESGLATVFHGDCLDVLRGLPDNSVDAVVTDPPYGLSSVSPTNVADTITRWATGEREYMPAAKGFMGASWDGFVPPPAVWDECFRVLKPGGHMAVFAGARTQDLMGVSIRLAGFEIRDSVAWIFGSGFPKSLDVSKAIDRARCDRAEILAVTAWLGEQRDLAGKTNRDIDEHFNMVGMAGHWTSTKSQPAVPKPEQWLQLKSLLNLPGDMDAEVWRLNGRKGTPGEAWDKREVIGQRAVPIGHAFAGSTYGGNSANHTVDETTAATDLSRQWEGWGTALKPAIEPITIARKPVVGTVAGNVTEWGTGGLNIDKSRVPGEPVEIHARTANVTGATSMAGESTGSTGTGEFRTSGRWPANVVLGEDAAEAMDQQSGNRPSGGRTSRANDKAPNGNGITHGAMASGTGALSGPSDGGASRFFHVFKYQAKAPKRERPVVENEDGTTTQHSTVKPLSLMTWLVGLLTPPGGTILDPFAGSGTTLEAATIEGHPSIGIEAHDDYLPLIRVRLDRADRVERNLFTEDT